MKIREIIKIVEGRSLTNKVDPDMEVSTGGASDLMSDVLAYVKPGSLLLTGLVHPQTVRTAEMADLSAIVFVRGKTPGPETVELAEELGIPLIASPYGMYELCGRLFQAGLEPTLRNQH